MSARIRTILLVSLVTALIWLWAEGESLSSLPLNPRVSFQDSGDLIIKPDAEWRGSVRLRVSGSTRALNDADRDLSGQIRLKPGHPGVPSEPGERQIVNLELALSQLPEIRNSGLSVQQVDPASTVVRIIRVVSVELPVRAELPKDVEVLGEPTLTPQRVLVRVPQQVAARLTADAFATVPISKSDINISRDDAAQSIIAAVRLPTILQGEDGVTITPDKVTVNFRLKRSVDSVTLTSVPVWFSLPPTEGTSWDIELVDQFLRDVTFTGPTDAIAKIRSREVSPIAEVQLSSDDLEKLVETKEAVFTNLPAGVDSGVAVKTVRLKITRRKNESPGGPADLSVPERVNPPADDPEQLNN